MKMVKVVYTGEYSGITIPELKLSNQKRGDPFEAPDAWAKQRIEMEPHRWKIIGEDKPKKEKPVKQEEK